MYAIRSYYGLARRAAKAPYVHRVISLLDFDLDPPAIRQPETRAAEPDWDARRRAAAENTLAPVRSLMSLTQPMWSQCPCVSRMSWMSCGLIEACAIPCSNVYCHGSTLTPGGTNVQPVWTTVNGTQAVCGTCVITSYSIHYTKLYDRGVANAAKNR